MTKEEAILILEEEAEFLYGGDEPYNKIAFDMAIETLSQVRCNDCKWYQGVHGIQGHAPCEWLNKQVLWNDFCSWGERKEV